MFLIPDSYYQVKTTKKKGRGVFARREIPAGTIIGDYLGVLMKADESARLEEENGNVCYSMDYDGGDLSIYPLDIKASGVHLLNHSCSPNCDTYYYYGHTLFFALRRILPGEELTIDYSFDADSKEKEFVQPCFCHSPFCRGTMYVSDGRLRAYGAFCRAQSKGQRFTRAKAGEILEPLDTYPREIKDNEIFNLFADVAAAPERYNDTKMPPMKELRKRLRSSGRILDFKKLGMKVVAIVDGSIVAKK